LEDILTSKYGRDRIKLILDWIGKNGGLEPVKLPGGGHKYLGLEEVLPEGSDVKEILEGLEKAGLLKKTLVGSSLACPKCHKSDFVPVLVCQNCGSRKVYRERLLEHVSGGHIGPESMFYKEGRLVCPVCKKELNEDEVRVIGAWFVCKDCGAKRPNVDYKFECLNDGEVFDVFTADFLPMYKYELTPKGEMERSITRSDLIEAIASEIKAFNKGSILKELQGKSGLTHPFDFVFNKGKERIIMDLIYSGDMASDNDVLAFFSKYFDVKNKGDVPVLLAWPKMSEKAKSLANYYKIKFREVSSIPELKRVVRELLS